MWLLRRSFIAFYAAMFLLTESAIAQTANNPESPQAGQRPYYQERFRRPPPKRAPDPSSAYKGPTMESRRYSQYGTIIEQDLVPFRYYVGLEYGFSSLKYDEDDASATGPDDLLPDTFHSFSPYLGMRFNQYFGAEIGYVSSLEDDYTEVISSVPVTTPISYTGYYIDAVGYFPLRVAKFDIMGSMGFGQYDLDADLDPTSVITSDIGGSESAFRIGFGAQYYFSKRFGARALIRRATFNEGLTTFNLGLNYRF